MKFLIPVFCLFVISSCMAQTRDKGFVMDGTVNVDSGTVVLIPIGAPSYYQSQKSLEARVHAHSFTFADSITYPTAYKIGLKTKDEWQYISGMFFVEPGHQVISVNTHDIDNNLPDIGNGTMAEWNGEFSEAMSAANKDISKAFDLEDSLTKIYKRHMPGPEMAALQKVKEKAIAKRNRALLSYVKEHPASYLVLWKLAEILPGGYEPVYDSIYNTLARSLRSTNTGIQLHKNLAATKNLLVGHPFPELHLEDTGGQNVRVPGLLNEHKYTLIDFWYSQCFPCLRQFPAYRLLVAKYKKYGFNIIGISIDDAANLGHWKSTIQEQKLAWPQYRDKNRQNTAAFCIEYYPTNFLLNEKGIIIRKNIQPEELEVLLGELKGAQE